MKIFNFILLLWLLPIPAMAATTTIDISAEVVEMIDDQDVLNACQLGRDPKNCDVLIDAILDKEGHFFTYDITTKHLE